VTQPPRRRSHRRRRRRRRQRRLNSATPRSFCRLLLSTRAFRSQLITRSWLAARYSPTPCPRSPITDIMHGRRLALHVVASPRHAARPHSQHPSSAFDLLPWNRRLHPSPRYVMNASIQQCMAANSCVCICAGTRHTGINGESAGETCQARRTTSLTGKFLSIVCLISA
jgi:hypothetical protein